MSDPIFLKRMYDTTKAIGDSAIVSDAMFEIEGYESMRLRTSQFPIPVVSPPDLIDIPGPLGMVIKQPVQSNRRQHGLITLIEPVANYVSLEFLKFIVDDKQLFNAKLHVRVQGQISRTYSLCGCTFWKLDPSEFSCIDQSQVLKFSGVLQFWYFGDVVCFNG